MSIGLIDTMRLFPRQDWVAALAEAERHFAEDPERRQRAREFARALANTLHERYGIGSIGIIGDLVRPQVPWNFWSEIILVTWDEPNGLNSHEIYKEFGGDFETDWLQLSHYCTQAAWHQIETEMEVLVGTWDPIGHTPTKKLLKYFPKD